jgi:hypothetical protein
LGKFYGVDPATFLRKPISDIQQAVMWTDKLIERLDMESAFADG